MLTWCKEFFKILYFLSWKNITSLMFRTVEECYSKYSDLFTFKFLKIGTCLSVRSYTFLGNKWKRSLIS